MKVNRKLNASQLSALSHLSWYDLGRILPAPASPLGGDFPLEPSWSLTIPPLAQREDLWSSSTSLTGVSLAFLEVFMTVGIGRHGPFNFFPC